MVFYVFVSTNAAVLGSSSLFHRMWTKNWVEGKHFVERVAHLPRGQTNNSHILGLFLIISFFLVLWLTWLACSLSI